MNAPEKTAVPRLAFGISKSRDMLAKFKRELNRTANSSFLREDLLDHANNCAFTAWHLTDWVWREGFARDKEKWMKLVSPYGDFHPQKKRKQVFHEIMVRKCPELALCQDICNGLKHTTAEPIDGRQAPGAQAATATATIAPPVFRLGMSLGSGGLGGPGYVEGGELFRAIIRSDDGETHYAVRVFNEVVAFWTRFLDDFHM